MSLIAATMVLSGCATGARTSQQGRSVSTAPEVDTAKMAAVDKVALSRGVRVIWINPPEKR